MENEKELWKIAKKRVDFKRHLYLYIISNTMFWLTWAFSGGNEDRHHVLPWPLWPMLGWGVGLAFNYVGAYHSGKNAAVQKEFEKLKKQSNPD